MDALQNDDVNDPRSLFTTEYVLKMTALLLLLSSLLGCLIGAMTSLLASIGPLSFIEAWTQFGATVAVAVGLCVFVLNGLIIRRIVRGAFEANATYSADRDESE